MVSTLVVGTNTYRTRAQATTYLGDSVNSGAWAFLSGEDQDRALLTSFRLFQKQAWGGTKTGGVGQIADFPRTGLTCNGEAVDSATVPTDVGDAQIELAYALTQDAALETAANTGSNLKAAKAGSASVEFFNSTDGSGGVFASRFPANVQELLNCYLASSQGAAGAEAFGTGCSSIFPPCCDDDENTAEDFNRATPF